MHRRTTRLNHLLLVVVGLVLLAAGAYLIARNQGRLHGQPKSDRLYTHAESRWLAEHDWIWIVVAAVAIAVGLVALRWLLVQPRIDRLRRLRLEADTAQHGRTLMGADVLTDAVEDDIAEYPGVSRARVLMTGHSDDPEIVVRVQAYPGEDLVDVHDRIVGQAVPDARVALDAPDVPVQVHLLVAGRGSTKRTPVR